MMRYILTAAFAVLSVIVAFDCAAESERHALVVYGATPAGIAAAVQAQTEGVDVVLIEPSNRIGGLTAGGLGQTDIGHKEAFGGLSRKFYRAIKRYYAKSSA